MMYDESLVSPMRKELVELGFLELRTSEEVDRTFQGRGKTGTMLLVVNSVCGCAAGGARPGVALALRHPVKPSTLVTVFAGQDTEATARARGYITGYPPSSPAMALFRDGRIVHMMERHQIEGRSPEQIAAALTAAFEKFNSSAVAGVVSPTPR